MEYALIFGLFAVILGVVVLRFSTLLSQITRSMSGDRVELLRELDKATSSAFVNAMTAMATTQERVVNAQVDMFTRTMDMVHGPQRAEQQQQEYAVDDPRLDARPPWMPDDEHDYEGTLTVDPTDMLMPDPPIVVEEDNGRAVSVRPGETLVPR